MSTYTAWQNAESKAREVEALVARFGGSPALRAEAVTLRNAARAAYADHVRR